MNQNIIQVTIRQRFQELSSTKITERRKGIENLKEYLYDDEVIQYLDENSSVRSNPGIKWDNIFQSAAECLVMEFESKIKRTTKDIMVSIRNLIRTIISQANGRSSIYLSGSKLINFIFEIWENDRARSELEDFCCNLSIYEILEKDVYWSTINSDRWAEFTRMAFEIYTNNPQNSEKLKYCLNILLLVLKHGTHHSVIALNLKKNIFQFLVKLIEDTENLSQNDFLKEQFLLFLIALSEELGSECKTALCKSGEEILPRLIRLIYDHCRSGTTLPIVSLMYKALLSQFNCHHPLGMDAASFAMDPEKWKDTLKRIYYIIDREITRLQKSKSTDCNSDFIHLSVHLLAWFYNNSDDDMSLGDITCNATVDPDESLRTKRIKLTAHKIDDYIDQLKSCSSPNEIWPLLHLIACLVFKFPKIISAEEYKTLLQMFCEFQNNNFTSNEKIMDYLYECLFSFLLAIEHVKFSDEFEENATNQIWRNIFQNTNRTIGLNISVKSSHLLHRWLLCRRPDVCQTEQLLQNFTDKVVSLNEDSLKTLFFLISKVQINSETRSKLVEWLLPCTESNYLNNQLIVDPIYPACLFVLCSNVKPDQLECSVEELDHFFAFLRPSHLEYEYLTNNFDNGLLDGIYEFKQIKVVDTTTNKLNNLVKGKQIIFNLDLLKKANNQFIKLKEIIMEKLSREVFDLTSMKFSLNCLAYWANVCKYITYLPTHSLLRQCLISELPNLVQIIFQKMSSQNLISTHLYHNFFNAFLAMNEADYSVSSNLIPSVDIEVLKIYITAMGVNNLPSSDLLESVMPVNTYLKELKDMNFHKLSLTFTDKQLKIFHHIVLMAQYGRRKSGDLMKRQKNVIGSLFDIADEYLQNRFFSMHLLAGSYIITQVVEMEDVESEIFSYCIPTLREMCSKWNKQSDVVEIVLLPLLNLLLNKVQHKHTEFRESLLEFLTIFYTLKNNKIYGASVQVTLVECFGNLTVFDPEMNWTISCADCLVIKEELDLNEQPLILELLAFIRSPFHAVRMKALHYLPFIFQSSTLKNIRTIINEESLFKLFQKSIEETLLVDSDLTHSEQLDEIVNRTACFLHALSSIIATSPCFSRQTLFYSLVMFVKKKINSSLFNKVLSLITKQFGINLKDLIALNIFYILTAWYKEFKTFRNFPFKTLSYDTEANFYKSNLVNVSSILLIHSNINELEHCSTLAAQGISSLAALALPKCYALKEHMILSNDNYVKNIPNFIRNNAEDIVLELLSNVTDYDHLKIKACTPQPCLTDISFSALKKHLDLLQEKSEIDVSLIEFLCLRQPDALQKINLKLAQRIYEARSFEFQIEATHRYEIFLMLMNSIFKQGDAPVLDYLIHSIIHTLIHNLSNNEKDLDSACVILNCLIIFLQAVLPQCSKIVVGSLPYLIGSLVPLTYLNNKMNKLSLFIIKLLVIDHGNLLSEGIQSIDPFPQTEDFESVSRVYNNVRGFKSRTSLRKEVLHFIKAGNSSINSKITEQCRLQGLENINYLLTNDRMELNNINTPLTSFEIDKLQKMINQLVFELSKLARSSNSAISEKAILCLGKIGPYSLNSTTLAAQNNSFNEEADILFILVVTKKLIEYLSSSNIRVVILASEALFHLLNSKEGQNIVDNNKLLPQERNLIYPFKLNQKNFSTEINLCDMFNEQKFQEIIDVTLLWVPRGAVSHKDWISNITRNIIDCFTRSNCYLKCLVELCEIQTDFAEAILRYLIYFIIRIESRTNQAQTILSNRISHFFSCHQEAVAESNKDRKDDIFLNKKSIQCMLDVVHFVRINQDMPNKQLLHLNYLNVAQAALYCSAYYSAILYSQYSCDVLLSTLEDKYLMGQSLSTLDFICNHKSNEGASIQNILRKAYTEIDDSDSVYGCGNSYLKEISSLISHYKHANNWHQAIQCSDILMTMPPQGSSSSNQSELNQELMSCLSQSGLYYIQTQISNNQEYDASWRLSQWNLPDNICEEPSFELYHYKSLKSLHKGETVQCLVNINSARNTLIKQFKLTDVECTKQSQPVLTKLQMLQEIEDFLECENGSISTIFDNWNTKEFIGDVEFKLIEPIVSQRCILLNESNIEHTNSLQYLLDISKQARMDSQFHISQRILAYVNNNCSNEIDKYKIQFEQAQLFWDRSELQTARCLLRMILPNLNSNSECKLIYSQALRTYGCWQASTKSENLSFIIKNHLYPALENLDSDHIEDRLKTYDFLARNADEKYKQITEILSLVNKMQTSNTENKSTIEVRQQQIDENEIATHLTERKNYLHIAMQYYIQGLAEGELNDIQVFRVVSLWLDNSEDSDLLKLLSENLLKIPSYKFIKVLPQLVARISNVQSMQNILILNVIEKCAREHPHHTLPLIIAVANSLKDEIYTKKSSSKNISIKNSIMDSRIAGAEYLLNKLKKQKTNDNKNLNEIIQQFNTLTFAYIIFANNFLGEQLRLSSAKHSIASNQALSKITDLDLIYVLTLNIKLNTKGIYDNVIGIHKFERFYSIPGGVNEPKKITCIGTNGLKYIQLLKGKDDPRQDAVMQQVFTIMNDLLKSIKAASKRNLSVVTYKVVPLSQQSGIIEWCGDSMPIAMYLLGDKTTPGAHSTYYPMDLKPTKCRDFMFKVSKQTAAKKLSVYQSICKSFHPVLRYFFLEKFSNATEWYSMQTNFTRSVATSSMIGYILGLGDRHLNNILISLKTAEVIHIDFGIAFEQGLILPTPETVPFRLTRDIEDGMGVTGIEGTFRKSCETTLSVLREHSETILTILEVLLYDPLYSWTLSPAKAAEKQQQITNKNISNTHEELSVNKIAARALFRLKQKLQGIEEGNIFSVEGQTNILIQRARDPENLCRLFHGWQPFL